jgi:hypothetical protein
MPIERDPRGTTEYELKVAELSDTDRRTVELAEESVIADRRRTHARRSLSDGTTFDLTAYDEFDVLLSFRILVSGEVEFIDFRLFDPE